MVTNVWRQLENKCPQVRLDEFVVMPNHIHGIIVIDVVVGAHLRVCPNDVGDIGKGEHAGSPQQDSPQPPLGSMIQWFKTMTTNYYIRGIRANGSTPFFGRFWQPNYYERIVRNENEMNRIREYMTSNPARWDWDQNNPNSIERNSESRATS
jgi:REP element-mobilizing transposase RayT